MNGQVTRFLPVIQVRVATRILLLLVGRHVHRVPPEFAEAEEILLPMNLF
jgi:hypothetical protein